MYFRCHECRSISWAGKRWLTEAALVCRSCDQSYPIDGSGIASEDEATHQECALRFAEASNLDVPTANSVLLGLMTLADALQLEKVEAPTYEGQAEAEVGADSEPGNGHEGAETQIAEEPDCPELTAAPERAEEDPLRIVRRARIIARRHDLNKPLSLQVARGQLTLDQALARRPGAAAEARAERDRQKRRSRAALGFTAAVGGTLAIVSVMLATAPAPERGSRLVHTHAEPLQLPPTEEEARQAARKPDPVMEGVHTAQRPDGALRGLAAKTPAQALEAFCRLRSERGIYCEPVEIRPTIPENKEVRLGVLRNGEDLSQLYAVTIVRRADYGRWIIGKGASGADPFALPR